MMKIRTTITLFLALVLAMTMGVIPVRAADDKPAEVQDTYEFDGIKYVNVGDKNFSKNQTAYYKAMLGSKLTNNEVDENMRQYSISDLWMQMAWYMAYYNNHSDHAKDLFKRWNRLYEPRNYSEHPDYWEPRQQAIMNLLLAPDTGEIAYDIFPFKWGDDEFNALWFRDTLRSAANSTAMAEDVARTAASMEKAWGEDARVNTVDIKNAPDESGLVFYRTLGTVNTQDDYYKDYDLWSDDYGHATHMVVVAFSDFTVTPIIPDENDTEPHVYVKSTNENTASSLNQMMVSDVKNASTEPATVSQSISESTSQTLTSNISGSSSHAVSQTHKTGIKFQPHWGNSDAFFSMGVEIMYEYNNTVTDTVTKGWSSGESKTISDSKTNNVSVTLPPYSAIMLNQKRSSGETIFRYNCPVALNFKATVYYVSEDVRGSTYSCVHFRKIAEFGGEETAMVDLHDRYEKYKIAATADQDFIRWNDMSERCGAAIDVASTTATFDSTEATFSNVTEVVKTEVDSILPIKFIRPVNVNDDSILTNQQWDFDIDMDEGDSDYLSRIRLKAINDAGVEFSSFNQAKGHFIVVDENGNEDTSGSIVELVNVNGQNKYVAKGEGTAYLKYLINEDEYQTANMAALSPDQYITNEDIENTGSTAVIQINVHHKHNLTRQAPKDPTCTEDGNIVYWTCSEGDHPCGKYFADKNGDKEIFEDEIAIKKTGHSWGEWEVTVQPAETTEGEETRECLNGCGEVQTKSVPVTTHKHKLTRHAPSKPTCTEDGNIVYWTCSEGDHPCGKYFSDKNGEDEISEGETVDPATGHNWGEWEPSVEPTETTEGEETRECLYGCGGKKTRTVPVLSHKHKMAKTAKVAPTCTDEGNIMYYTCGECSCVFTDKAGTHEISPDEVVLSATGHKWDAGKVTKKATIKATGIKTFTCTVCGKTKTATIAKLGKKVNPLKVKGKTATIKYKKLKKKTQSLAVKKVIKLTKKGQGKMSYKFISAKKGSRSFKKYFRINKKTGKLTIKKNKKMKKGTYKVKVKVKAAGNANYKASAVKTVIFKVKVK